MTIQINGTTGISGVDGSAGTPALQGSDSNTGIAFGSDVIIGSTGGSERFRCDSSGRMLVGTSSAPINKNSVTPTLVVSGSGVNGAAQITRHTSVGGGGALLELSATRGTSATDYTILQSGDGIGTVDFLGADGDEYVVAATIQAQVDGTPGANDMPGRLTFWTTADGASSSTERMRIGNDGSVYLSCTATPTASVFGVAIIDNGSSGRQYRSSVNSTATYNHVAFLNTNGVVGTISSSGSATTYSTSSDYRLKDNIVPVNDGIIRLQKLKPSRFNFKADLTTVVDGFIAHEVQTVVPEAIVGEKDAVDADGNPIYQGIDQSKLVPLLTAALQEAVAKIESLETRLAALEVTP